MEQQTTAQYELELIKKKFVQSQKHITEFRLKSFNTMNSYLLQ